MLLKLSERQRQDRFRLQYLFNYAQEKGETTTRNQYGELKYDHFFTKKLYAYGAVELLNDKFKDYRLRTIVVLGWDTRSGMILLNRSHLMPVCPTRISVAMRARMTVSLPRDWEGRSGTSSSTSLSSPIELLFYPSLGHGGDFLLRNEAALTAPLSARWALRLANIVDYDSNPPVGIKKTDSQYILSLQFSF